MKQRVNMRLRHNFRQRRQIGDVAFDDMQLFMRRQRVKTPAKRPNDRPDSRALIQQTPAKRRTHRAGRPGHDSRINSPFLQPSHLFRA